MHANAQSWAQQPRWCELQLGHRQPLPLLQAWHRWRQDAQRPGLLHVVAVDPWPQSAAQAQNELPAELAPLAGELAHRWWGLTPGFHRLSFEGGRVLLTLCIGLPDEVLRELSFAADAVQVGPALNEDAALAKPLARLCRRGTQLAAHGHTPAFKAALASSGFLVDTSGPTPDGALQARYDPSWSPRGERTAAPRAAGKAIVIGGGLAGAAAAASLARRGWQVRVLDAAESPAGGASGLPAGLLAPHLSPDDNLLSRLSRAGLRITLEQARALLREGHDWQGGGVLEHRLKGSGRTVQAEGFAADWSRAATPQERERAFLPPQVPAAWHGQAAWISPGALVQAWLGQSGIEWRGGLRVGSIERSDALWRVLNDAGQPVDEAPLVVIAAALGSAALAGGRLWLQPVRGQVSWALHTPGLPLPAFPVNGHGHLLPSVPMPGGQAWMTGSTYGRGETGLAERPADHLANHERLRTLVPLLGAQLAPAFASGQVKGWTGVRCASTDRRPLVGEIETGLWVSTAMGSRGLTFAALCGEVLAARLHAEPLPLPLSLAAALDVQRQLGAKRSL